MYANISTYQLRSDVEVQPLVQKTEQDAMTIAENLPGFQAYYFVRTAPDRLMAISLWESQADLDHGVGQLLSWVQQNMASYLAATPDRSVGEVVLQRHK